VSIKHVVRGPWAVVRNAGQVGDLPH
jgi:hypothetical protein